MYTALIKDSPLLPQRKAVLPQVPVIMVTGVNAATHCTLDELSASPNFRKDLYDQLRTHHINVPPLRERKTDLPLLVAHFIKKAATELNKNVPYVPSDIYPLLNAYHFPGNVRELEAMIFDAISNTRNGKLSLHNRSSGRAALWFFPSERDLC
jgi:transcriptional regulator with PAS, ATPase and Fis domain